MRIHAIQTGFVVIKNRQRTGMGHGRRRFLSMLLDRTWTEPLPILAWLIEHPEGLILVDTGETARAAEDDYFPSWHPYYRFGVRALIKPEYEIGSRLREIGVEPGDVHTVVMTHLHTDHAGGLHHFPQSVILVTRTEARHASGFRGRLRGYLNNRFPRWFDPRLVDFENAAFGPFSRSKRITKAGDVHLVPVPGHTPGQMGVVVEDDDRIFFIAGDTSYSEQHMLDDVIDGVAPRDDVAHETLERVRALAAERPTVYLPSHDPNAARRLQERTAVPLERDAAPARQQLVA